MNSRLLFLTFLAVAAAVAGPRVNAQRGLTINPPASRPGSGPVERPASAPDAVVAQKGASPDPGEIFRDCNDCPELVVVPPGDFVMGSNDTPYEKPERKIAIPRPLAIGRQEVTFAEWDLCADAGACKHRPDDHGWGRGDRPVINVGWDDAKLYLAWLSQKTGQRYRLPSKAEWEYAARAGTKSPFWWGRDAGAGRAVRRLRQSGQPADLPGGIVSAERLWTVRYGRKCRRMGRGLLERQLSKRPQGRRRLDQRRLPSARAARRQLHQQAGRCAFGGAVSLRLRCSLLCKRLPDRSGIAVTCTPPRRRRH